jgi:CRISPR-associated endonuclease/helicase Cas3
VRDGALVPYAEDADPGRAWALSEVSVARYHIADCPPPAGTEAVVDAARATWGRWERESDKLLLAVLTEAGEGYVLEVKPESGKLVTATYFASTGLNWPQPA